MNYWLFKSEPDAWSWDQQEGRRQGRRVGRRTQLPGTADHVPERRGDFGFFYHSGEERRVVGVVKVVAELIRNRPTGAHLGVRRLADSASRRSR